MTILRALTLSCGLLPLTQAYSVFETNCSLPSATVSYVSSPNTRGTLDIVWSCLGVLVACTYSILHPNVPARKEHSASPGRKTRSRSTGHPWFVSAAYAAGTLLVPEVLYVNTICVFASAREELKRLRKHLGDAEPEWTLTHIMFADMGGFVLLYKIPTLEPIDSEQGHPSRPEAKVGTVTRTAVVDANPVQEDVYLRYHLNAFSLRRAIEEGLLSRKAVPIEHIRDRSKSDWFAKVLVLLQLSAFFVGIIARVAERLVVTPLEVAVCSFAVCSIIVYGILFHRPKNVETPTALATYEEIPQAIHDLNQDSLQRRPVIAMNGRGEMHPRHLRGTVQSPTKLHRCRPWWRRRALIPGIVFGHSIWSSPSCGLALDISHHRGQMALALLGYYHDDPPESVLERNVFSE